MRDVVIVSVTLAVVALVWGMARRAEQPVRTCLGLWAFVSGSGAQGSVVCSVRVDQPQDPAVAHGLRQYMPCYRAVSEEQASLAVALQEVREPITIHDASVVARALVVYCDLCDLGGSRVATVEPNGRVNLVRS